MLKNGIRLFIAIFLLWSLPVPDMLFAQGGVSFRDARRDFQVGRAPYSITAGDFNDDGIQDLAVANYLSNNVSILLGNDDGTFEPARNFPVGMGPFFVTAGDFNGDAIPDLAVANIGTDSKRGAAVSVLLGNGDGTFGPARDFPAGMGPDSVVVGDFNGDSKQDLAVANFYSGDVSILLGNGDGTFAPAQDFPVGSRPRYITAGDFNGDEIQDLAVVNGSANSVSILLGNGDGTFEPVGNFWVGSWPSSLAVGDFNGDSIQDLAVANEFSSSVSILLGNGDGTFAPAGIARVGRGPRSLAVGDFNGDKVQDLAVVNLGVPGNSGTTVSILLGHGDGTFSPSQNLVVGRWPSSLTVGDFNGDKIQDLAVANNGTNAVSILLGRGDGTFESARDFEVGIEPRSVAAGDFNGDKIPDLAVVNACGDTPNCRGPSTVSILIGNGDGTFEPAGNLGVGFFPQSVAVGDFDGDKIQDLAVANNGTDNISIMMGNGDGTFQPAQNFSVGRVPMSLAVGDFNGDKLQDLAVANAGNGDRPGTTVSILLGHGDGTFEPARNFEAGRGPYSVAVGDFNGDTIQDLAVANWNSSLNPGTTVSILLGNGDGTFGPVREFGVGRGPRSVTVGDFNSDDIQDLAVANWGSNDVSILLGNGDGTFGPARNWGLGIGSRPWSITLGDFNGDRIQDLAIANHFSNTVSILLGKGDGTFEPALNFGVGSGPTSLAIGDFHADERQDLAVANTGSNSVSILINDSQ